MRHAPLAPSGPSDACCNARTHAMASSTLNFSVDRCTSRESMMTTKRPGPSRMISASTCAQESKSEHKSMDKRARAGCKSGQKLGDRSRRKGSVGSLACEECTEAERVVTHHFERTLEDEPFVVLEARHVRVWVLLQHKVAQFGRLERNESRGSPLGFVQVPMRRTYRVCVVFVCACV